MSDSRHAWLGELASLSPRVAALGFPAKLSHKRYGVGSALRNSAASRLSASADHNAAISQWIEDLPSDTPTAQLEKLLSNLTSDRNQTTYGTFSELAAYGAFAQAGLPFKIQVPMCGRCILNPNGSYLDGEVELHNKIIFDVKGFGLHEYLIEELLARLNKDFDPDCIIAEGTWDVAISALEELLDIEGYRTLKAELSTGQHTRAHRCGLELVRRPSQRVQISTSTHDPYAAAERHADYAFRFAKQFPRRRRFFLVFVYHPWMGGFRRHHNFAFSADIFMRSLARRTFLQFRRDRKQIGNLGVTRATASRLLSGLLFIDAWQDGKVSRHAQLFLNPNAKHSLSELDVHVLRSNRSWLRIDDFSHDFY